MSQKNVLFFFRSPFDAFLNFHLLLPTDAYSNLFRTPSGRVAGIADQGRNRPVRCGSGAVHQGYGQGRRWSDRLRGMARFLGRKSKPSLFFFLVILVVFPFSSFSLCSLSSTSRRSLSIMVTRFHTGRAKITRCKEIEIRPAVARIQEEHKQRATEKRVDKWDSMQFRI